MLLGWATAETRADAHCICLDQFSRRGKTRGKGFSHKKRRQGYRSWDTCISCRQATHLTPLLEPARLHAYEKRLSACETLPPAAAPWAEIEPRDDGLWACDRRAFENVPRAWALRRDAGLRLIPALPPSGSAKRSFVFLSGGPTGRPGPWRRLSKRATSWSWHMCRGNAETWGLAAKVVHNSRIFPHFIHSFSPGGQGHSI